MACSFVNGTYSKIMLRMVGNDRVSIMKNPCGAQITAQISRYSLHWWKLIFRVSTHTFISQIMTRISKYFRWRRKATKLPKLARLPEIFSIMVEDNKIPYNGGDNKILIIANLDIAYTMADIPKVHWQWQTTSKDSYNDMYMYHLN